ncbi:alpha/beta hydrolase [Bradyrhizobium sp. Leo121]|uniref:alpha/beta fold hydrolase n=1 Tax=Bradyrhizobium sp. Leo121 TaxID=1571195 RepID=UPI0013EF32C5|nr:alpha/beta hydrolase [Bradyrhizobium sp. Leo121]
MQDSESQANNMTRRGAMTIAGATIATATIPTAGTVLAQSAQGIAAPSEETRSASTVGNSVKLMHKRVKTNGVTLHYVTVGRGPVVLCMHGWPQNHREFLPVMERLADSFTFIAPDLRGYADSDKPYDGYEPKTIAQDMIGLLDAENVTRFHILSHDLGGPPSVALAYLASNRAWSLATIETPFFGLSFPGYVDPRVTYWHLGMHMNMDVTRFLVEGREEQYLRHFFRDFAYNPDGLSEEEVQFYVMQMRQPGNLRASLNHYGYIPQMADQTKELTRSKLAVPMLAWAGRRSFGDHCINSAKAIASNAEGGVIEECGHWVFEEKPDFIVGQLSQFWQRHS